MHFNEKEKLCNPDHERGGRTSLCPRYVHGASPGVGRADGGHHCGCHRRNLPAGHGACPQEDKSPILSAAKAINLVAAMVSILSLETAMLAQFGGDDDPLFRQVMTGATGGGVCTIVIGMAIYMIWRANKNLKKIEINNSQT